MQNLLDAERFLPLANLVAQHGIRYFIEPDAGGEATGMEAAMRLNLQGYACDEYHAEALHARFPQCNVYDGDPLSFLREVLPKIDGPAYFWVDANTPTSSEQVELIDAWSAKKPWFVDVKQGSAVQAKYRSEGWTMNELRSRSSLFAVSDVVPEGARGDSLMPYSFDRSEDFDRNWHGPDDMKPRVYRTQSEKDTWHAVVVDNEYRAPESFAADDVVLDIGAHIGSFSWLAYRLGSRRVYAFEVDPWHLEAARENLLGCDLNPYSGTVDHAAVVRSDAKRLPQYHYGGQWHVFGQQGIPVPSVSLDELIDGLGSVRFIKTDCEGSEWPILYTCTKLDQVQEIAGEYHEDCGFSDYGLPPCTMLDLAKYLWEGWGFHVTFSEGAPGIGNFFAKRA